MHIHVGVRGQLEMLVLNHSLPCVPRVHVSCVWVLFYLDVRVHKCGCVCTWVGSPVQIHVEVRGWHWGSFSIASPPTLPGQHPEETCPSPPPRGNTGAHCSVWFCGWWGSNSGLEKLVLQDFTDWAIFAAHERIFWLIGVSCLVLDRGYSGVYTIVKSHWIAHLRSVYFVICEFYHKRNGGKIMNSWFCNLQS